MGDLRFEPQYERVSGAHDPLLEMQDMSDSAVVEALGAAARANDPYLANVLATEAMNRMQRARVEVTHLGEGLCSIDAKGRILTVNPAAELLLGRSQAELRGQNFDSLCRDGNVDGPRSPRGAYLEPLEDGVIVECDSERFFHRDGTAFDVFYTAAPIVRSRRVEGVVIAFRDISARKLAAGLVTDSEARYRSLFENSPDFMFSTDMAGLVTAVSTSAAAIIGFERAEVCGAAFDQFIAPADVAVARRLIEGARGGKAERASITLLRKDARAIQTSMLAMPIIIGGEVVGVYGLAESNGDAGLREA